MRINRVLASLCVATLILTGISVAGVTTAGATSTTSVIGRGRVAFPPEAFTPPGWFAQNDVDANAPDVTFVTGPPTAPAGTGSARFHPSTGVAGTVPRAALEYVDAALAPKLFTDVTSMGYSSYRETPDPGGNLAVTLSFVVDYDKTDTFVGFNGRITFEPYFTVGSGNVLEDTWQSWSPMAGKWWASSGSPRVGGVVVPQLCGQSTPCTWNQFKLDYPNAGFLASEPGMLLKAGGWSDAFVGYADNLTVGINGNDTIYDFEPNCSTDCYVSTTGSDSNPGTAGSPFATIQKAIDTVNTGGAVHVASGTYNGGTFTINKSLSLLGPNAGVSPNDPGNPATANPARTPEATLAAVGLNRVMNITAQNVTVDGFRVTDPGATSGYVNDTLIGAGVNFGGEASGVAIKNNVFDGITRTGVYFNGPTAMTGGTIDDNRVVNPGRASSCGADPNLASSGCGHQLFNPWQTDGLSIQRNVLLLGANDGGRIRGFNLFNSSGATIKDNTIQGKCIFTCITISGSSSNADVEANNVSVTAGNVLQFFTDWSGGTATVMKNVFTDPNDYSIVVDNPSAVLTGLTAARNSITAGGFRNASSNPINGVCNWWGQSGGPAMPQNTGPLVSNPWLTTSNLNQACAGPGVAIGNGSEVQTVEGSAGGFNPLVSPISVTLSAPQPNAVVVAYTAVPGTAKAAANDYKLLNGSLTFLPGETSKNIPLTIKADTTVEDYEFFDININVTSPDPATVVTPTQHVVILNDDKPPVTLSNATAKEGSNGVIRVTLKKRYFQTITTNWNTQTVPGPSAFAPGDYDAASGNVSFPAGTTGVQSFAVHTNIDGLVEPKEQLTVKLLTPNANVASQNLNRTVAIPANSK